MKKKIHDPSKIFSKDTNFDLQQLLINLIRQRVNNENNLYGEVSAHETRVSSTSNYTLLNKPDLLKLIYAIIYPEIRQIDDAPIENLPLMINNQWSCPQLKERLINRMRGIPCCSIP
jgi:hypothetical protein